MKSRETITSSEMLAIIVILFAALLLILAVAIQDEKTVKQQNITKGEQKRRPDFPFEIKCNGFGMAYYMVPLIADNMSYGIVPVPVIGADGKCVMCGTFEVNNKKAKE